MLKFKKYNNNFCFLVKKMRNILLILTIIFYRYMYYLERKLYLKKRIIFLIIAMIMIILGIKLISISIIV